jgi:hypothetical protein
MTASQLAGWAILALIVVVMWAGMVYTVEKVEGFKVALIGVTAIFVGCPLLVVLVHFSMVLIKS